MIAGLGSCAKPPQHKPTEGFGWFNHMRELRNLSYPPRFPLASIQTTKHRNFSRQTPHYYFHYHLLFNATNCCWSPHRKFASGVKNISRRFYYRILSDLSRSIVLRLLQDQRLCCIHPEWRYEVCLANKNMKRRLRLSVFSTHFTEDRVLQIYSRLENRKPFLVQTMFDTKKFRGVASHIRHLNSTWHVHICKTDPMWLAFSSGYVHTVIAAHAVSLP